MVALNPATQQRHGGHRSWRSVCAEDETQWPAPVRSAVTKSDEVVGDATYDAQGRRIVQQVQNSADLNHTEHYYHAGQRVVEIRNGSGLLLKQQLFAGTFNIGDGYVDQLLQVALNEDPFATDGSEEECEAFFYALHDANYNLLALVDEDGAIAERYEYTPYGQRTVYFSPGTNDPLAMAPTTMSRRWQVGGVNQPYGLNTIGHQGLSHDEVTGLVYNRARMLHPRLGRFMQRDPLGYVDGMNLYEYVRSNPHNNLDPFGLQTQCDDGDCRIAVFETLLGEVEVNLMGAVRGELADVEFSGGGVQIDVAVRKVARRIASMGKKNGPLWRAINALLGQGGELFIGGVDVELEFEARYAIQYCCDGGGTWEPIDGKERWHSGEVESGLFPVKHVAVSPVLGDADLEQIVEQANTAFSHVASESKIRRQIANDLGCDLK